MKKQLLTIILVCSSITVFTGGIHRSYAQSNAPVHTGQALQSKSGGLFSQKIFVAPIGFFKKSFFLPGNDSSLKIGSPGITGGTQNFNDGTSGAIAQNINTALFNDNHTEPIVIDLYGRSGQGISFPQTDNQCSVATRLIAQGVSAFEFKNDTERAHIVARQVQLTGNDPQPNKILVSDAVGNTRWASASVVNGQVVFSQGTSVVESCIVPPPDPIDLCSNIAGIQPMVPKGYIANIDGTCTLVPPVCPATPDITPCTGFGPTPLCNSFDGFDGVCSTRGPAQSGSSCIFTPEDPSCIAAPGTYLWASALNPGACMINEGNANLPSETLGQYVEVYDTQCVDSSGIVVADSFCGSTEPAPAWNSCSPSVTNGIPYACHNDVWVTNAIGVTNTTCTQPNYMPSGQYLEGEVVCVAEGQTPNNDRCDALVQSGFNYAYDNPNVSACIDSGQPNFCPPNNTVGCMNSNALNYSPSANTAGTCQFDPEASFNIDNQEGWIRSYTENICSNDYVVTDSFQVNAPGFNFNSTGEGYDVDVEVYTTYEFALLPGTSRSIRESFSIFDQPEGLVLSNAEYIYKTTNIFADGEIRFQTKIHRHDGLIGNDIKWYRVALTFTNTTTGQTQTLVRHYDIAEQVEYGFPFITPPPAWVAANCTAPAGDSNYLGNQPQDICDLDPFENRPEGQCPL